MQNLPYLFATYAIVWLVLLATCSSWPPRCAPCSATSSCSRSESARRAPPAASRACRRGWRAALTHRAAGGRHDDGLRTHAGYSRHAPVGAAAPCSAARLVRRRGRLAAAGGADAACDPARRPPARRTFPRAGRGGRRAGGRGAAAPEGEDRLDGGDWRAVRHLDGLADRRLELGLDVNIITDGGSSRMAASMQAGEIEPRLGACDWALSFR